MRRPNKPHQDGYEDEEDCCGYFDPDEVERRDCHHYNSACSSSDLVISDGEIKTGRQCFEAWKVQEDARDKAEWDAKTPEEQAKQKEFLSELGKLY